MSEKPFYITAAELAERGLADMPEAFRTDAHLIWNSPAALDFNSPGAQGFGVKRAGLSIPGSIMLLISPGCCGRNTAALRGPGHYGERFAFYELDDNDIVTGRHLKRIPEAVQAFVASRQECPTVVMLCLTCVDALLGTDMDRVCERAEEACGIPVRPCYMYALTRDGSHPPMVAVREAIYGLLQPTKKHADACNILGFFTPLAPSCELPHILGNCGVKAIRQLATCADYAGYQHMAEANFNLVLDAEARAAAAAMEQRLHIPYIELRRTYQLDKVANQYRALMRAIGAADQQSDSSKRTGYEWTTRQQIQMFCRYHRDLRFAIGSRLNANPFDLALAFTRYGLTVEEIFANPRADDAYYVKQLGRLSPHTRIYTNLSPSMVNYRPEESTVTFAIGEDALWYHPDTPGCAWNDDIQPFGFAAIHDLFGAMAAALHPISRTLHHPVKPCKEVSCQ